MSPKTLGVTIIIFALLYLSLLSTKWHKKIQDLLVRFGMFKVPNQAEEQLFLGSQPRIIMTSLIAIVFGLWLVWKGV